MLNILQSHATLKQKKIVLLCFSVAIGYHRMLNKTSKDNTVPINMCVFDDVQSLKKMKFRHSVKAFNSFLINYLKLDIMTGIQMDCFKKFTLFLSNI